MFRWPGQTMEAAIIRDVATKRKSAAPGHGGARAGAGKPLTPVDMQRVLKLREEGYSMAAIAKKLDVSLNVIKARLRKGKTT